MFCLSEKLTLLVDHSSAENNVKLKKQNKLVINFWHKCAINKLAGFFLFGHKNFLFGSDNYSQLQHYETGSVHLPLP